MTNLNNAILRKNITNSVDIMMNTKPTPREIKNPFITLLLSFVVIFKIKKLITNLISGRIIPRVISIFLFTHLINFK